MFFTKHSNLFRWLIVLASFIIISLILWNTYVFFQYFKEEQRTKMDIWASAMKDIAKTQLNDDINTVSAKVFYDSKYDNPMILIGEDGQVSTHNNLDSLKLENQDYVQKLIREFEAENPPIELSYFDNELNFEVNLGSLYYGNSPLINKLKYYPLALLLIIFLFGAVVYFFYRSTQTAAQNKLWSGMAKETAHQIGTPLSSLVGWTEILKSENVNPSYLIEIEKDISRLQTITERFSKEFEIKVPEKKVFVNLNKQLYSWTIENLVKNGIDAMKGKGKVEIEILPSEKEVKILVTDTGKGLQKKQYNAIFEPGYTTKKRGWGLGLSLAKRIIEEFHQGKIKVLHSEVGKGTTIQISLKTLIS